MKTQNSDHSYLESGSFFLSDVNKSKSVDEEFSVKRIKVLYEGLLTGGSQRVTTRTEAQRPYDEVLKKKFTSSVRPTKIQESRESRKKKKRESLCLSLRSDLGRTKVRIKDDVYH